MKRDLPLMALVFIGAACAVLAASDTVPSLVRVGAGAVAAGCGAVVALLRPPGGPTIGGGRG